MKLKPKKGLKVLKPDGTFLNDAGEIVEKTSYWIRRIKEGEVEVMTEAVIKKGKQA